MNDRTHAHKIAEQVYNMLCDEGVTKRNYEQVIGYAIAAAAHDRDQNLSFSKIKDYYDDARSYLRAIEED